MHFFLAILHFVIGIYTLDFNDRSKLSDFCFETLLASGQYILLWILFHYCFQCEFQTKKYICFVQIVLWTLLLSPVALYLSIYEDTAANTNLFIYFSFNCLILISNIIGLSIIFIRFLIDEE